MSIALELNVLFYLLDNSVVTEDKYGSSAALEMETADKEAKKAQQDEGIIHALPKLQYYYQSHFNRILMLTTLF